MLEPREFFDDIESVENERKEWKEMECGNRLEELALHKLNARASRAIGPQCEAHSAVFFTVREFFSILQPSRHNWPFESTVLNSRTCMRSLSRRRLIALVLPILNLSPISRNSFNHLGRKKVNLEEEEVKRKGNKNRKKDLFPFLLFLREKRFFKKRESYSWQRNVLKKVNSLKEMSKVNKWWNEKRNRNEKSSSLSSWKSHDNEPDFMIPFPSSHSFSSLPLSFYLIWETWLSWTVWLTHNWIEPEQL